MAGRGFRVLCRNDPNFPFSIIVESSRSNTSLLIESSAVLSLVNDCSTEEYKKAYLRVADGYGLMGILRVSKDESFLLVVTGVLSMGQIYGCDVYRVTMVQFVSLISVSSDFIDPRVADLQRLISSGMFYFASSAEQGQVFDLTLSAQRRIAGDRSDHRFFWNRTLHFPLERYGIDSAEWFLRVICGSVQIRTMYIGHRTAKLAVISRLSCERVGTRFNVRGVNGDGNVANFVETEQLILYEESETSFVQIRGSVPLFWEQPGVNVGSHKVKLRAFEASAPAFDRHFHQLKRMYGGVVVVNLLGSKEGERMLAEAYKAHHRSSSHSDVEFISFDYHAQMKLSKTSTDYLKCKLNPFLANFSFFHAQNNILRSQRGVIRTNCLDCLDRTNSVQTLFGLQMLPAQLECLSIETTKLNVSARFEELFKDLWQKNGDFCSVIYAGTGALEGKSKFKDASRSLARTIQNNLMDSSKQESFDLFLLGSSFGSPLFDRISCLLPHMFVQECINAVETLVERGSEMVSEVPITIFAGTWNVNGGKNLQNIAFRNQAPITDWLFPRDLLVNISDENFHADIVAVGLEEIVDLNASNIMKASTTNQRLWCDGIRKALATRASYVLLGCEQLVGVCLFVFVKPHLISSIRDFSVDSVKTGMGGAAGNKGSIALRLTIHATSLCFVCSHFAAGQNEVRDRNEDFLSALRKIRFPMGREVLSHDVIIWMGDFNYRISLPGEEVKKAIRAEMFAQLAPNDQLTQQRSMGYTFIDFEEGVLNFAPTYKYDTFSDDYDTSEKCRAPAWTDRVLWKDCTGRRAVSLLRYGRSELKTSDHRPVSAVFQVKIWKVDPTKCEQVFEDVASSMGPPDGTVLVSAANCSTFPSDLYYGVLDKLTQLGISPILSKFEGADLWLVLESGEMALAALSMDGVLLDGVQLGVRLRTPEWMEHEGLRIDAASYQTDDEDSVPYAAVGSGDHFEFDEDDEELCSRSWASSQQRGAPPQPSPGSEMLEGELCHLSVGGVQTPRMEPMDPRPHSTPLLVVSEQPLGSGERRDARGPSPPPPPPPPSRHAPPRPASRPSSPRVQHQQQHEAARQFPVPTSYPSDPFNSHPKGTAYGDIRSSNNLHSSGLPDFIPAVPPRPK